MECRRDAPRHQLVHAALIIANVAFGSASVMGKFATHGSNPALFALVREGLAGPLLCIVAYLATGEALLPPRSALRGLLATGFAIATNQLLAIVAIKLIDPIAYAAWGPSQPILTLLLAVGAGYEKLQWRRALGILIAAAGAVFMVAWGAPAASSGSEPAWHHAAGHVAVCCSCLYSSLYVIWSKPLAQDHPPILVQAWSYIVAGFMTAVIVCIVNSAPSLLSFVCSDRDALLQQGCIESAWTVPRSMVFPLVYYILVNSMFCYFCVTWANRYTKASVVSAYTVLQPLSSGLICAALIIAQGSAWADTYGLTYPGVQDLGAVVIIVGLAIAFSEGTLQMPGAWTWRKVGDASSLMKHEGYLRLEEADLGGMGVPDKALAS